MQDNNHLIRSVFIGFAAGTLFWCLSVLLTIQPGNLTLSGIAGLHRSHSVFYLLDLLPLMLAVIFYRFTIQKIRIRQKQSSLLGEQEKIISKIRAFAGKLIRDDFEEMPEFPRQQGSLQETLLRLRDHLREKKEKEKIRKKEEEQRNWVSEGIAHFGEIMRMETDNMEKFSYNLISNLVNYLDTNQGGFFLVESDSGNKYFDLKACYAYDRRKFANKQVPWGNGLIGTVALEKQSMYMSDVPQDYLEITSGLGTANPENLLIVPLTAGEEVIGIIELASFRDLQAFEIRFAENIAEIIAVTLSNVKSNVRTAELLEESRKQAETLTIQEEKMRQNMEELKATQEQAARQAEKFISFTNSVNHTLIRAEYFTDGTLLYANTKFLKKLGYSGNAEVEGKHISMFIHEKDREWFEGIWKRLAEGGKHYEGYMKHVTRQGQDLWTMATYTCVRKDDGSVEKILFLAIDTTEHKKQSLDYEGQIEAIDKLNLKAEFAPDGKFINCNHLFLDTMKFTANELDGMSIFDLMDKKDIESFSEIWENIIQGQPFRGQVRHYTKYEDEKWFRAIFTSVNDMYGEVAKVIYLGNEITHERIMELETRKQTDQIRQQEEKLKFAEIELNKKIEQAEKEMKSHFRETEISRNRYEGALQSSGEAIFIIDHQGNLRFVNKQAEKLFGHTAARVVGKHAGILFPGDRQEYDDYVGALMDPAQTKITGESKQVRIRNKDKQWINASMYLGRTETADDVTYTVFIRPEE